MSSLQEVCYFVTQFGNVTGVTSSDTRPATALIGHSTEETVIARSSVGGENTVTGAQVAAIISAGIVIIAVRVSEARFGQEGILEVTVRQIIVADEGIIIAVKGKGGEVSHITGTVHGL